MPRQRGRRGEGSIRRRKGGYQAQWSGGKDGTGKRIRRTETFTLKTDAEWWLRQLNRGTDPETDLTVAQYLERWLDSIRPPTKGESTWTSYAGHVRLHIVPMLGEYRVSALLPRHVEALIADRLKATSSRTGRPLSPATVALIVTTLRIALGRGVRRRELPDNAAADVPLPHVERPPIHPMTEAESDTFRDAFAKHWLGPLVELLAGSALRLGEALALNQGDVGPGFVRLRKSKTTIRAVPISEDAEAAIDKALAAAPRIGPKEPLFFSPRPNRTTGVRDRLAGSTVSHAVPRVVEAAGLGRLTPHGFRHGAATRMLSQGASLRLIQEQLGHKDQRMTQRYAHVVPEQQRATVALLNRRKQG